jgi:hypothetical protein
MYVVNALLYKRYIDDQNVVIEALKTGQKYDPELGEIVQDPAAEEDNRSSEERTFEAVRLIGDSVNHMIQLTVDHPEKNENGRVPILDLEVWMIRDSNGFQKILYSFYEKPMKSQFTLMKDSAVSMQTKRNSLTQEAKRRLRNCHEDVPKEEVAEILSEFAQKLKNSGYREKFRCEIIKAGVMAHKELMKLSESGEKPMFRSRNHDKAKRKRAKQAKVGTWWKNVGEDEEPQITVIKVPYTPESKLLKLFQEVARKHQIKIKFIELSGYSLQNLLEKANPFREKTCGRTKCFPCESGGGGNCQKIGAAYQITCEESDCLEKDVKYGGETGRPGYTRGVEHLQGFKNKSEDNMMWKHSKNEHHGNKLTKFVMKVIRTYGRDNLTRKVNEAIRISSHKGVRQLSS